MDGRANVDARTALGVRPGARPTVRQLPSDLPPLHIGYLGDDPHDPRPPSPHSRHVSLITPQFPDIERNISGASASTAGTFAGSPVASSSVGAPPRRIRRPTISRKYHPASLANNRGQHETQKLLSHLLDRMEARRRGPDILDRAVIAARQSTGQHSKGKRRVPQLGQYVAAAVRGGPSNASPSSPNGEGVEDDHLILDEGDWDTDAIYDMLEQARDILNLAERQGLDLFKASHFEAMETANKSLPKKSRIGRLSTIASPTEKTSFSVERKSVESDNFGTSVSGLTLLTRLSDLVRSLITTDCLYISHHFTLLQPPYALHAMCLDVAALVYHKGDLAVKLRMMDAVIQALYTMGDVMRERICKWLEGRLAELLRLLAHERGQSEDQSQSVEWNDPFSPDGSPTKIPPTSPSLPTFAFSITPGESPEKKEGPGWKRFSPTSPSFPSDLKISGILSTHCATGNVSEKAVSIAALIPRLLVAFTSTIDLTSANLMTIHGVHRLVSLILVAKPDAGQDLLEIVAHGPRATRRRGMDFLSTFFPKAVGHNIIARRPALATYRDHLAKWETGLERTLAEDDTESHFYVPWRSNSMTDYCMSCQQPCAGFSVRCTLCDGVKHLGCLRLPHNEAFAYDTVIMSSTHGEAARGETVFARFSLAIPRLDEKVLDSRTARHDATQFKAGPHALRLVNLFTLTLCGECREPLWGATAQAYACMGQCQRFFHPACAQAMRDRDDLSCRSGREVYVNTSIRDAHGNRRRDPFTTTSEEVLKSFQRAKDKMYRDPEVLADLSFDEIALLYANLWNQREICINGMSAGTLRLADESGEVDVAGLTALLAEYEKVLDPEQHAYSPALIDYSSVTTGAFDNRHILWRPRYLQYCSALIRAPSESPVSQHVPSSPAGLLTVNSVHPSGNFSETSFAEEPPTIAYEELSMPTIRQTLARDMHVRDDIAASVLIEQMSNFGLCSVPYCLTVNSTAVNDDELNIDFPLPLLMDSSPAVELLVLVIEQLLDDIDLTGNEQALWLLVNRAWPNAMCSPYAMERLGGAVMSWVMAEDDVLHHIVKRYASKTKKPPGVRTPALAGKGNSAVATYKDDRRRLRVHYAHRWLKALYRQDADAYVSLAYERSKIIDNRFEVVELDKGEDPASHMASIALERITAFVDAQVMFDGSLDLVTAWLEDLGAIAHNNTVYKSLPRLLQHTNSFGDSQTLDLWALAQHTIDNEDGGWQRVCRWLRVLACSGVYVPWPIIKSTADVVLASNADDESLLDIAATVQTNAAPIDGAEFAALANKMFVALAAGVTAYERPSQEGLQMVRTGMDAVLKAYRTTEQYIEESSLKSTASPNTVVPSLAKKKHALPQDASLVPLSVDVLRASADLMRNEYFPAELVLDFLWLLFVRSPGAENPDGFLHQAGGEMVYDVVWQLYDRPIERRSRARVFLKLLTINPLPAKNLVMNEIETNPAATRERLLTFVLELADDEVTYEVNNWRRAAVHLIMLLFRGALRLTPPSPETLVIWNAFLPPHLHAMSLCFEEYIVSCSDEQRLKFLARLIRLRSHFPNWKIVGWDIVEQLVTDQATTIEQLEDVDTPHAQDAVAEVRANRASVLALGLYMLSSGVEVDWMVLHRFQQHVAAACSLPWPKPDTTITDILLPALKVMVDSTARVTIKEAPTKLGVKEAVNEVQRQRSTLVGSLFVSIVIHYAKDLSQHNFMVQRHILDILMVVFFKHKVQAVELSALSTLQVLAQFAAEEKCSEHRCLALQILQIAQAHMDKDRFTRVLPRLFVSVADIMMKESTAHGDPAVVDSGRTFLQESMSEFGKAGLFLQVLYMDGEQQSDATRSPDAIGRAMQIANRHDVAKGKARNIWLDQLIFDLHDLLRWGRQKIGLVMTSLSHLTKTLEDELSEESSIEYGSFLSKLAKQAAEAYSPADFDPNPVLQTSSMMLKLCPPSTASTLLDQTSTFLHFALARFSVQLEQIDTLIPVSVVVARRQQVINSVETALFEMCGEATKGAPVTPVTLNTLLAFLARNTDQSVKQARLTIMVGASAGCASVLFRTHPTIQASHDPEVTMRILNSAAEVVIRAEMESAGTLGRVLLSLPKVAVVNQLEMVAHVLYASLDVTMGDKRHDLVTLYPVLARSTGLALFASADLLSVHDPGSDGARLSSAAFLVMRLVVLAMFDPTPYGLTPQEAGMTGSAAVHAHDALGSYWRRIWPEWERLLSLSLSSSCVNAPLRLVTLAMLLDIVLFVSAIHPALLTEPAPALSRGLRAIQGWHLTIGTSPTPKLAKALAALERSALHARPAANAQKTAKDAIWADMLATERITSLRAGLETRAPTRHAYRNQSRGMM